MASMQLSSSKLCVYDEVILTLFVLNYKETFKKNHKDFFLEEVFRDLRTADFPGALIRLIGSHCWLN